ncbi:MAG: HEAT repeat domain-containing protein [Candidatus Aminicenantes bacterium]|nr:HEAT repeat domain-containing protein [Candidatus Aminicenantes bacterium]
MTKQNIIASVFLGALVTAMAAFPSLASAQNTVTFDNQSGEPALVRMIGPTSKEIEIPNGTTNTVEAAAGKYTIMMRYGRNGEYSYEKGEEFEVTETDTTYSSITITLHKVVSGNYESHPISEKDFADSAVGSTTAPATRAQTSDQTKESKTLDIARVEQSRGVNLGGKYPVVINNSVQQEHSNRTTGVFLQTTDGRTVWGILMKASSCQLFIESHDDLWVMPETNDPDATMRFSQPGAMSIELLISVLDQKDDWNPDDSRIFRKKVIEALGNIGDIRAKPQLTEIAERDSDPELRAVAQSALEKLR